MFNSQQPNHGPLLRNAQIPPRAADSTAMGVNFHCNWLTDGQDDSSGRHPSLVSMSNSPSDNVERAPYRKSTNVQLGMLDGNPILDDILKQMVNMDAVAGKVQNGVDGLSLQVADVKAMLGTLLGQLDGWSHTILGLFQSQLQDRQTE
ncbi:hypothetical protein QBC46DRAFT_414168 [Diplogelasinospora grovesii]|uniref:Uncharacterized protein n=1 Tax=Diplogelasinospora grovesii TaxID=303347 RepID=A0AAN6RYT8_9PEZI|nr:hypothetical protein QBC46DRAFT_414168 [Diplogelasinospora grovesii]